jgi:hypothetical protein
VKATINLAHVTIECEGAGIKELFQELAEVSEAFGEQTCGKCGSDDLKFVHRESAGNHYYEMGCRKCGARLAMGQPKVGGGLYPKRYIGADGSPVKGKNEGQFDRQFKGWHHFGGGDAEAASPPRRQTRSGLPRSRPGHRCRRPRPRRGPGRATFRRRPGAGDPQWSAEEHRPNETGAQGPYSGDDPR